MKSLFNKKIKSTPPPFIRTPYTAALKIAAIAGLTCLVCNPNSLLRFSNDLPVGTFRDAMIVLSASLSEELKPIGIGNYLQKKREAYFAASKQNRPSVCITEHVQDSDGRSPASVNPKPSTFSKSNEKSGKYILLGDSLLKSILERQMTKAITAASPNASFETIAEVGGGITRPDIVDWVQTTESLEDHGQYEAAFIFLGTNDMQGIHEDGHGYRFGSDSWKKHYIARVKSVLNNLCTYTTKVFWVPPPPVRDEDLQKSIETVTDLLADFVPTYASNRENFGLSKCVEYVSPTAVLAPEHRFTPFLRINNEEVRIRENDGIHLTNDGAKVLTDYLMKISGLLSKGST